MKRAGFRIGMVIAACVCLCCAGCRDKSAVNRNGESARNEPFPLWNGQESVEHYAERAGLAPTKRVHLGSGIYIECVLIPAGEYMMGWAPPKEPRLSAQYVGLYFALVGPLILVVLIGRVHGRSRQEKSRPRFSLSRFLIMTLTVSLGIVGYQHWRASSAEWDAYVELERLFDDCDLNEKPARKVVLREPFYMSKTEITQTQFKSLLGGVPVTREDDDLPAHGLSYDDALSFCTQATRLAGVETRLPSEAEWEFACRAGTETLYYSGNSAEALDRVAWHGGNAGGSLHRVGRKEPNPFGLFDMHGNVAEWCRDHYRGPYGIARDTPLPKWEVPRVLRGGSIVTYDKCASRARMGVLSSSVLANSLYPIGLRIVVPAGGDKKQDQVGSPEANRIRENEREASEKPKEGSPSR